MVWDSPNVWRHWLPIWLPAILMAPILFDNSDLNTNSAGPGDRSPSVTAAGIFFPLPLLERTLYLALGGVIALRAVVVVAGP